MQAPIAQAWVAGLEKSQSRLPQIRPAVQVSGTVTTLEDEAGASHLDANCGQKVVPVMNGWILTQY